MSGACGGSGQSAGFTLVELVIFILVASMLGLAFFSIFGTMVSDAPQAGETTKATQLAQERLELILAQKHAVGFAGFTDPCPAWAACTLPDARYTVAATINNAWSVDADTTRYAVITVTITDIALGRTAAEMSTLVASY